MPTPQEQIRNFCIIAHIDHGKSTLADRILDVTGAVSDRERREQTLDSMELERERGITIKASSVRLYHKAKDGKVYEFNLIDTPGHVDFNYEVSRSLKACEGAVLVVDASQGVEAQTLANVYLAVDQGLDIVPAINKIDLPSARPDEVRKEIEEIIGINASDALAVSAKMGTNVPELLERVVEQITPPKGNPKAPLKALVFDSWFDEYQGVICLVRVVDGSIEPGTKIKMMSTGANFEVLKVGAFSPKPGALEGLYTGEVGFVIANIKALADARVGDTMTLASGGVTEALPGFKKIQPMVFAGLYPISSDDYGRLKEALQKLQLNDSSITFEPETSSALGFGFRCGFLGLLHMDIIQERLEREYNLDLLTTAPSVIYRIHKHDGTVTEIDNPSLLPEQGVESIDEPVIEVNVYTPADYIGVVVKLCVERRGVQKEIKYITPQRAQVIFELPMNEIVLDFHDRLKSATKGYASFDYKPTGYQTSDLVRLNILVNGDPVDALSVIVHRDKAFYKGRDLCEKLKELIPRQMYEVAIQAAIGGRIIARSTVKALRKDVLAKCYGGDVSRKRKLLEKQKEGKKRMKNVGSVEIPQEAFLAVLKVE